jgi:hypothetical protein
MILPISLPSKALLDPANVFFFFFYTNKGNPLLQRGVKIHRDQPGPASPAKRQRKTKKRKTEKTKTKKQKNKKNQEPL